jgi:hypothetical protein
LVAPLFHAAGRLVRELSIGLSAGTFAELGSSSKRTGVPGVLLRTAIQ